MQSVQGFAYVRAFGYLHDSAGDDVYRALFGDPELGGAFMYPNSQNATSNTSLAQGAGCGPPCQHAVAQIGAGAVGSSSRFPKWGRSATGGSLRRLHRGWHETRQNA